MASKRKSQRLKNAKSVDKSYSKYVSKLAIYGVDPMSKEKFKKIYRDVGKNVKLKTKTGRYKNQNIDIANKVIKRQIESMNKYDQYKALFRKAQKQGMTLSTEYMPADAFFTRTLYGGTVKDIVMESYKTNPKQVKQLVMEAKMKGLKVSIFDIYKQNSKYNMLVDAIREQGWSTIESWSYEDGEYNDEEI